MWYATQYEHWLRWLKEQNGPGYYVRKDWDRSAAFVYNHIVNPQMLIYLAEASGLPRVLVRRAADLALRAKTMPGMSAQVRKEIPWSKIEGALLIKRAAGDQ